MSAIYLIRHGQAGTRENYDQLSALGEQQARLLGEHLSSQAVRFDAVYAGGLRRQQQTASIALTAMANGSDASSRIETDERWNEFILRAVYEGLVPRLMADDAGFAADFAAMQREIAADPHSVRGAAGRCDRAVIEAWMEDRYPLPTVESWAAFQARVRAGWDDLTARHANDHVAVFTSVTPIAVCIGATLRLDNDRILRLMAAIYNSSLTIMRIRFGEPMLFTFNTTPHLADSALITFR